MEEQLYFEHKKSSENDISACGSLNDTDNANDANEWTKEKVRNFEAASGGLILSFSLDKKDIKSAFEQGKFVLASFSASRAFNSPQQQHVEKTVFKDCYSIKENVSSRFHAYLLDMKMTHALAIARKDETRATEIEKWFDTLQSVLRDLFEDQTLKLAFDDDTFRFSLEADGREPFDLNSSSDGFSAVLEIVSELMLRMQRKSLPVSKFLLPGIALIDEIESHLHIGLQRRVLDALCRLFPIFSLL